MVKEISTTYYVSLCNHPMKLNWLTPRIYILPCQFPLGVLPATGSRGECTEEGELNTLAGSQFYQVSHLLLDILHPDEG